MKEYHKIQSVFMRDEKTHKFREGAWTLPEFEYLNDNPWVGTEKVDGTNIRVMWEKENPTVITFRGRQDAVSEIQKPLLEKLTSMFSERLAIFDRIFEKGSVCLYGEGYGPGVNKAGKLYGDAPSFVLFDVYIDKVWLRRESVENIAYHLNLHAVPIVARGNLPTLIEMVKRGMSSTWGNFQAEGLVIRPEVELFDRLGNRIITKVKTKDFLRDKKIQVS